MKRATFTLFQPQRWMSKLGQSTLAVLFMLCLGIQTTSAQKAIPMPSDSASVAETLSECNGTVTSSSPVQFTDDGSNDGNYADSYARADTATFCPSDQWHRVKIVFTEFDLADGDTLFGFQGDVSALNASTLAAATNAGLTLNDGTAVTTLAQLQQYFAENPGAAAGLLNGLPGATGASLGTGSGAGIGVSSLAQARGSVSDAFGGWIDADCDPTVNATGCLTFVFTTNGDRAKGTGWDAWVDCEAKNIDIAQPANQTVSLTCDDKPYSELTITAPAVTGCGESIVDSMFVMVTNQAQDTCLTDTLSATPGGFPETLTDTFAVGIYTVRYVLLSDPTKVVTSTITVQAANLVCNDNIVIPFGSACQVAITPDMVLEQPCDTIQDTMRYSITVTVGDQTITGAAPILTKEMIRAAGMTVCNGTASITITRTFLNVWSSTICNNGEQSHSCTTELSFNDASAPIFTSAAQASDTLVACSAEGLDALITLPDAIDNCDSVVVTSDYTAPDFANNPCDTQRVTVIYTATDECGNTATQTKLVVIVRPETAQVTAVADATLECNSDDDSETKPGLAIGRLTNGVFVPADTIELSEDEYVCGYILTHSDATVPAPGCGKKVFRTWSVLDWCNPSGGPSTVNTQFINYTDTQAPDFADNNHDSLEEAKEIDLGPFVCETTETPAAPTATDACSKATVTAFATEQYVNGAWAAYSGTSFPCDTFRIRYAAADDCPTQPLGDTASVYFIVRDVTSPSAICTDELIVSVGSGAVRITASDLDAGSYDACETLTYKVRRKGASTWEDQVDLTCADKPSIEVELQVTGSKSEPVTCWSKITVEDKIAPVCNELEDATRPCTMFHPDQYGESGELVAGSVLANFYNTNFGNPFDGCSDNCGVTVYYQSIDVTRGDCGAITVVRSYKVVDWGNLSSPTYTQTITVTPVNDFKLTFPADQNIKCSDANQAAVAAWDLDDILTENNGCDIFALEVTEREFTVAGDFCKKIERTYEVINWCTYTAGGAAQEVAHNTAGGSMVTDETATSGRFVYTQIIKYSVDEAPEVTITAPDMCISSGCSETKTFSASAENCLGAALTNFTYKLKVTDAAGGVTNSEGETSSFDVVVVPGATYEVEFWGFDDCGNSDGASGSYTFMDCVRPTPYVLNGLAVEIMQTGEIQVWASDLDRGSFDNCTPSDKLDIRMALGTPDEGPQRGDDVSALDGIGTSVTFNCDLLGTTQFVSIYVIDEKGNWDVVGTYVFVQDNLGVCPGVDPMSGTVAGKVTNAFGENVELVNVTVNGGDNAMATNATGEFAFNLPLAGDYTITPEKNINPLNGVSTFDLVLISKHILGLSKFDSPYKYIAADVNKSGSITAFDMVQLRQLILNVTSEFTNNTSWRFIDAKHEFTSANPAAENFDEFMSINNLDGEMLDVNFIAAKIGDVNGTATANSLLGAESRNVNGTLNLNVTDRAVKAGQTVTVDFTSADIASAQGYQFTMDFAGLDLVELKEGVAKAANFNTNIADRGVLTTSWNGEATANEVLFSLTFTATTNGLLSELISVNSDLTVAEAYNNAGELMNVALDFNTTNVSAAFGLNQNTPNPFNGETVIGFNLPEAGAATLKVMDAQGKVLTVIEQDGVKGYNQVTINAKTLGATGVLYYQLESADNIATKKMIIIE